MHYFDLILYKTYAELRRDIASAYLGVFWWVLEPLIYMAVFYAVFSSGLRTGGEGFASFLLCGLASWKWFSSSLSQSANSIVTNKGLIQQVYVPKLILPLIPIFVNIIKFVVIFTLLILFLSVSGNKPQFIWLLVIPVIGVQLLLILGLSWVVASIIPFIPDLRILVNNGLTLLMFLSGIFFDISSFPEATQSYFYLNPMVSIIDSYRLILLHNIQPDWTHLSYVLGLSICLSFMGLFILHRFDRYYPKVMA